MKHIPYNTHNNNKFTDNIQNKQSQKKKTNNQYHTIEVVSKLRLIDNRQPNEPKIQMCYNWPDGRRRAMNSGKSVFADDRFPIKQS